MVHSRRSRRLRLAASQTELDLRKRALARRSMYAMTPGIRAASEMLAAINRLRAAIDDAPHIDIVQRLQEAQR